MMRLRGDLAHMMWLCATGRLDELDGQAPEFDDAAALTVVLAAKGYPGAAIKGGMIDLADAATDGARIFQAGTALEDGALVANGGRVLTVAATGDDVTGAQKAAYESVDRDRVPRRVLSPRHRLA